MMKRLATLATGACITGAIILGAAGIAAACTATVTGTATCEPSGTNTVDYTVTTAQVPQGVTGSFGLSTSSGTFDAAPVTFGGNGSFTVIVNDVPSSADSTSLTVNASWSNGVTETTTGTVPLGGTCATTTTTAPPTTTTVAPVVATTTTTKPPPPPPTTTVPPPTTTSTIPPFGATQAPPSASPPLAATGAPIALLAGLGAALILVGTAAVLVARRIRKAV